MNELKKRTWAEISLGNIRHNFLNMRAQLPEGCRFLGVVKADAYGHGAARVAAMLEREGCDYLAVACIDEAAKLRACGITLPILILGPSPAECAVRLAELRITQAVGDIQTAREYSRLLEGTGLTLKVHMKLETGMGRTGFRAGDDNAFEEIKQAVSLPNLIYEGVFTHFAVSDEFGDGFTDVQFGRFMDTIARIERETGHRFEIRHCTNSGAMINYEKVYLDMVRPGIALYGCYPAAEHGKIDLRPAMQLRSRIAVITEHKAGDSISYGRTFIAQRDMRIAVLPVGYADGLHRLLSGKLEVLINGKRCKQVGRICMDMCMVDVTGVPDVKAGDIATVFGHDGGEFIPVEELAEKCGTISYELLCAVSPRVPRVYDD